VGAPKTRKRADLLVVPERQVAEAAVDAPAAARGLVERQRVAGLAADGAEHFQPLELSLQRVVVCLETI
jgi:hypothetical protein